MPVLPKRLFGRSRGRHTDNDEAARRRARGIDKLRKSYEEGGAYNDIDNTKPASDTLDAAKDYDMVSRVRSARTLKHTRLPKKKY